jgi:hypothetical protein
MIVRLNIALRNAILDNIFNSGSGLSIFDSGTAEFRTGSQPAAGDDAATGTVVCTVALAADAMAAASAGSIAKSGSAMQDLSADNAGTIGWARFKSSDGTKNIDFDVTDNAGSGAIKVDNPTLTAGQQFSVTSFTLTMPGTT